MQHLHDGQAGVEANKIGKLERTHRMMGAEPHCRVDPLNVPDAFIECVDRLVDHWQQDAIDDEGREILRYRDGLVKLDDKSLAGLEGGVVGSNAADKLDKFH